jgi:hypothetical protein
MAPLSDVWGTKGRFIKGQGALGLKGPEPIYQSMHPFNYYISGTLKAPLTGTSYMDHIIREMFEIDTHCYMDREDDTRSRKPLIDSMIDWWKHSPKHV